MLKKLFLICSILVVVALALGLVGEYRAVAQVQASPKIVQATKFDAHYRVPNEGAVPLLLEEQGVSLDGLSLTQRAEKVQGYLKKFHEMNPDTVDPAKLRKLLEKEQGGSAMKSQASPNQGAPVTDRSIKSLVALMEFNPAEETWTSQTDPAGECVDTQVTMAGPLHNEITPPGPRDNNTIWYQDTTPELYNEIYFGEGPKAGVIIDHPNLGQVDLRGKTMVNYYLEMSGGKFAPAGAVYPEWFQAQHSEGWYGEDGCAGSHNVRAGVLVQEAIEAIKAGNPDFDWQSFDGNADGIVDNFTVIHAGAGQEAGGGAQGNFAIWSHASLIGWPEGYLACAQGAAGCPDRDIRVLHYSMDPENIDLGVISEEFGHAAFGLPDLYTTDAQGSISNWAIMESGSWNGILGGAEPAPFPLWFKYMLGWVDVKEYDYTASPTETVIGQLEKTPRGMLAGLKINLPTKEISIPNPLGTGQAWWSDVGDAVNYSLTREVDLTGAAAPILTFASYWSIEEDWDYGYVKVSTDGGATWDILPDMDGIFRTTDPNGNNRGVGLTGENQGTLRVDLAAYAGQQILLRLEYSTDTAAQWDGWFVDDIALVDGAATLWSDDVEAGAGAWVAEGWQIVPLVKSFPRYYLVEWRNNQGFDHGLQYPYATVYYDEDEWQVDRG
ncbi:MAG: M6 family metalloprotease domain-containing protein, partial [Chloroflexi bacterium]